MNSFTTPCGQAGVQLSPRKQDSTMCNSDLHRQTPSLCLPYFSRSFIHWAWCHMVWDIPVVSYGQLSHLCPLLAFCAPPAFSGMMWAAEKALTLCEKSSAITITSLLSAVFPAEIQNIALVLLLRRKLILLQPKPAHIFSTFCPPCVPGFLWASVNASFWPQAPFIILYLSHAEE